MRIGRRRRAKWVTRKPTGWHWPTQHRRMSKTQTGVVHKFHRAIQRVLFGTNYPPRRSGYTVGAKGRRKRSTR